MVLPITTITSSSLIANFTRSSSPWLPLSDPPGSTQPYFKFWTYLCNSWRNFRVWGFTAFGVRVQPHKVLIKYYVILPQPGRDLVLAPGGSSVLSRIKTLDPSVPCQAYTATVGLRAFSIYNVVDTQYVALRLFFHSATRIPNSSLLFANTVLSQKGQIAL